MTTCKACGAEIAFVKMQSGKMNPVNPEPVYVVITEYGKTVKGWISHFATCPSAKEFRKKEEHDG